MLNFRKKKKDEVSEMDCPYKLLHAQSIAEWRGCMNEAVIELYVMVRDILNFIKGVRKIASIVGAISSPVVVAIILDYFGIIAI